MVLQGNGTDGGAEGSGETGETREAGETGETRETRETRETGVAVFLRGSLTTNHRFPRYPWIPRSPWNPFITKCIHSTFSKIRSCFLQKLQHYAAYDDSH